MGVNNFASCQGASSEVLLGRNCIGGIRFTVKFSLAPSTFVPRHLTDLQRPTLLYFSDADVLPTSQANSLINTSTIDLAALHGYQLQLQLASLSPHQLLIPVSSSGLTSNLSDHFIIPVNMTPAIITSSADQPGFIVQNVSAATENDDVIDSQQGVELTQAVVQTDLSIPVPAGEISQESLAAANIEGKTFHEKLCIRCESKKFYSKFLQSKHHKKDRFCNSSRCFC